MIYGDHPIVEHRAMLGGNPYVPNIQEIQDGIVVPNNGFRLIVNDENDLGAVIHRSLESLGLHKEVSAKHDYCVVASLYAVLQGFHDRIRTQAELLEKVSAEKEAAVKESTTLEDANRALVEQLAKAKQALFGTSSEKSEHCKSEHDANDAEDDAEVHNRKLRVVSNAGRKPLPAHLPREDEYCRLSAQETKCPVCAGDMSFVGNESTERLEMIPARAVVKRFITEKYVCRCGCNQYVQSRAPKSVIPGSSYGSASVLAEILTNKFQFAIPLYRQTQMFARAGLKINRTTLANLVINIGIQLETLWDLYRRYLLEQGVIHADETTTQVLKEPGRSPKTKSYMWQYCSSAMSLMPLVLFDYQETRAGEHALNFLTKRDGSIFDGYLQVDGYAGYNVVNEPTRVGCMAHLRRYFVDVLKSLPESERSKSAAQEPLTLILELYVLEASAKNMSPKQRFKLRKAKSLPILNELKNWLDDKAKTVMPKSLMGKAIHYALGQWNYILNFIEDGELSIDNNIAERSVKAYVIGRKNWLFADTVAGAKATAVISSVVRSAVMNDIDPYKYLMAILQKLPDAKSESDFAQMLPWVVKQELADEAALAAKKAA